MFTLGRVLRLEVGDALIGAPVLKCALQLGAQLLLLSAMRARRRESSADETVD